MVLLGIFVFISAVALISIKWISVIDGFWKLVWWVTVILSLIRITCLWIGIATINSPGTSGILGYFLVLTGLPEALFVRQFRNQPNYWGCVLSLLIPIGSFVWAFLLGCVAAKAQNKRS